MPQSSPTSAPRAAPDPDASVRRADAAMLVLLTIAFLVSYTQYPLYFGNQDSYFIHGLADAGHNLLAGDWLTTTADPFPVFSALVRGIASIHEALFYAAYAALLIVYLWTAVGIAARTFRIRRFSTAFWALALAVTALHASAFEYLSVKAVGINASWLVQFGLAGQYILGPVFQPSAFGVLLVLSVWLHLRGRPHWAVVASGAGVVAHPSYLLPAAVLTAAYMADLWLQRRSPARPLTVGLLSLAVVLPVVLYATVAFEPTSPALYERAQAILVEERFPHHALPGEWLRDPGEYVRIALMLGALVVTRGRPVGRILGVALGAGALLTLVQTTTGSRTLALLFPWRISAVLVPISTALLVGAATAWAADRLRPWIERWRGALHGALAAAAILVLLSGLAFWRVRLRGAELEEHRAAAAWMRAAAEPGDLFLVPPDLGELRIDAGVPLFVDWKTHPYRDVEVLEWYDRVGTARAFYRADEPATACSILRGIAVEYGVTHVVTRNHAVECAAAERVRDGDRLDVYELRPSGR